MTHELQSIIEQAREWQKQGHKMVLASVVALEGSSYRKPGVRMLLNAQGQTLGAVSGGCVEKEVQRQAQSVFEDGVPKIMTYDGRLRLGCEGVLYLLLEPFEVSSELYQAFTEALVQRIPLSIQSAYQKEFGPMPEAGTTLIIADKSFPFDARTRKTENSLCFTQSLPPLFRLLIIGAEHDAVQLCKAAAQIGWEVTVVAPPDEQKTIDFFCGAKQLITPLIDQLDPQLLDSQTAVVLMTHSYNKDVQYLTTLKNTYPAYFGLLGPQKRREQLIDRLLEFDPEVELAFIDQLRGPAGLNIGAASAAEIAVSILAEILAVTRAQNPIALKDKEGAIHA